MRREMREGVHTGQKTKVRRGTHLPGVREDAALKSEMY
jgi:hypothetical protein